VRSLSKPPGDPASPGGACWRPRGAVGAALNSVRLDVELQARLAQISVRPFELRASRQRIVAAQDAERRGSSATCTTAHNGIWLRLASTLYWRASWSK
jgi:hypothetical protein